MPAVTNRLLSYSRFVKIEHTVFALPLIFAGAVLAGRGLPSWTLSGLLLAAGAGARTVAFALNRIIDRHIDAKNPRTSVRELPKGTMSLAEAWGVCAVGAAVYFLSAWAIAPICFYASPIPIIVFTLYPYLKRFTPLAHCGVGLADALAPLGGWVAVTKSLHPFWPGFWLAAFTFFWVTGFDIIYSTMDEEFDREAGLFSMPATYGRTTALHISGFFHIAAFGALAILYHQHLQSLPAFVTLLAIGVLLGFEQMKADDVELAFFKINAVLGFGVLGFVALGLGG